MAQQAIDYAALAQRFGGNTASGDESAFRSWYADMAKQHGLSPNPDDPKQLYDYRAAFQAGASPDRSGHWPSQFKKPGHPNEVVGGFNTRTGDRVSGTPRADEQELVRLGWDAETAKRLAATPEPDQRDYAALAKQFGGTTAPTFRTENQKDEQGRAVLRPEDRAWTDEIADFARGVWKNVNPVAAATAVGGAITSPIETAKNIGAAQDEVRQEMVESFKSGDYITGARKLVNWLIPLMGPAMDAASDKLAEGHIAEGLGEATGVGLGVAGPAVLRGAKVKSPSVVTGNAAERSAVDFGLRNDIPVDAGTATGNRFVKGVQRLSDESALGSVVAERAGQAQAQALAQTGAKLADRAKLGSVTAEQAGQSVRQAVEASITRLNEAASKAYDRLRALEAKAAPQPTATGGTTVVKTPAGRILDPATETPATPATTTRVPVTKPIPLAVDLRPVRAQLEPLYKELSKERELIGTLQGGKGRTLVALDRLMEADDAAPLSVVDAALGDLKAMARTSDIPALRTPGQATAAQAVRALEKEVQAAAARGGPNVMRALMEGRAFTKQKYVAADLLDDLVSGTAGEPVRLVKKLTANQDAAIAKLRALEKVAPQELPAIGRVVIDELLDRATKEGGFTRTQGILADWQKLGADTKQLLYGSKSYIRDLDDFFLLAKKLGENPNPSGTALTLTKSGEVGLLYTTGGGSLPLSVGAGALSKLLHSPTVVRALVRGLSVSTGNKSAASAAVSNLLNAAREAGVSLERVPVPAEDRTTPGGPPQ